MLVLAAVIVAMLLLGSQALPAVRTFSWQDKAVTADDAAFMLVFTQPMNPRSVEENLKIEPDLPGKFSWAGRRMAYTLAVPAPYGETYRVSLADATSLSEQAAGRSGFESFSSEFRTRDRVFAYVGAQGEEQGRLVLFNITRKEKTLLTPAGKTVMDFRPYPARDRILFSATDQPTAAQGGGTTFSSPQLYSVSTGLASDAPLPRWQIWRQQPAAGDLDLILDNKEYQNLKFDLSPNGKVIVIQRVNQQNPSDFGPWVLIEGAPPRKLKTTPGGDFTIAPDSVSLLLQQGEGTAVISLEEDPAVAESDELLLDFLPDYGLTLDIASDGSAAALVNFNQDDPEKQFTQSLFWVSNQGEEKPLLETDGSIISARFSEDNKILYCLVSRLAESAAPAEETEDLLEAGEGDYTVIPYLTAVNIKTGREQELLEMPPQPEITVSLSPDGLAVLFDEAIGSDEQRSESSQESSQKADEQAAEQTDENSGSVYLGATHRLWLLPLFATVEERLREEPTALPPAELEIAGRQPMWLP